MLKDDTGLGVDGRGWSKVSRTMMAFALLAVTVGVATVRPPASKAEDGPPPAPPTNRTGVAEPFETSYLPDGKHGVVAFRPARMARRLGSDVVDAFVAESFGDLTMLATKIGVDISRPGFIKLRVEDIESIACGFAIGHPRGGQKNASGEGLYCLEFSGLTVRTSAPFDWPAFFRQWTKELDEVRVDRGVYYKSKDPALSEVLMGCVFYQPDNRTLVFESESRVKQLIARETSSSPDYLRGTDWERVSRGLVAVAFNNRGDTFAKAFDLGRPDDKVILKLVEGIDRWVLGVGDADSTSLVGEATARNPESAEAASRSVESLVKLGSAALATALAPEADLPASGVQADAFRLFKSFLAKLNTTVKGSSLEVRVEKFGTFAVLSAGIRAELGDFQPKPKEEKAKSKASAEIR